MWPPFPSIRGPRTGVSCARGALLLAALALGGCAAPRPAAGPQPAGSPRARAGDRLLERPELQAVVDAQERRDAAALLAFLEDGDPDVRARAAFALGSVQAPASATALARALRDAEARVRADAAFGLGQSADSTASAALLRALADENDATVIVLLLGALGKVGDAGALRAVAAREVPGTMREALALSLARFGMRGVHDPAATERVLGLLEDPEAVTRAAAAYALARPTEPDFWRAYAGRVRAALERLGPDDPAAAYLATALGRLRDPADTPALAEILARSVDWRTRVNAARALASRADPVARDGLLLALEDSSHHVRRAAAEALGGAETADSATAAAVGQRLRRLQDRMAAAALLPALVQAGGEEAAVAWVRGLPAADAAARAAALQALGSAGGAASLRLLEEGLASEDSGIAGAAAAALAARWRAERAPERAAAFYPRLREALLRRDVATATAAAGVLGDTLFRPLGSVALLMGTYGELRTPEHLETMTAILDALGEAGDTAAAPLLREALAHPAGAVRLGAAGALERLTGVTPQLSAGVPEEARSTVSWSALAELGARPLLVLETERGTIVLELRTEEAPLTVQTIAGLAASGAFDGVPFHRVVPNFVIQGGDVERGDGWGGPGYIIRSEFTRTSYRRGVLGMASAGKDTEGSQYFITHSMQPHLDGRYTAFGFVVRGMDVVDRVRIGDIVVRAYVDPSGANPRGIR